MAFEGYHYWRNWREYIAVTDESGLAEFIECGALIVKTEHNNYMRRILEIAPNHPSAMLRMGEIAAQLGEDPSAPADLSSDGEQARQENAFHSESIFTFMKFSHFITGQIIDSWLDQHRVVKLILQ